MNFKITFSANNLVNDLVLSFPARLSTNGKLLMYRNDKIYEYKKNSNAQLKEINPIEGKNKSETVLGDTKKFKLLTVRGGPNDLNGWILFNSLDDIILIYYSPNYLYRYSDNEFVAVIKLKLPKQTDVSGTHFMHYLVIGDCGSRKSAYKYKEYFGLNGNLIRINGEFGYIQPYEKLKSTDAFVPLFELSCKKLKNLPLLVDFSKLRQ